jgi:hypothetical protein
MPQAGWCRECGEWVWVDPEGACQNGHDPECVGGIYDAEEKLPGVESIEPDFGVGDMPVELSGFNWGAFLLPLPWGVGFGVWSVVLLWTLMALVPLVLVVIVGAFGEDVLASNLVAVGIVAQVIASGIRLWIGANATTLLWRREHLRLELIENARPRFSVAKFVARQRTWARVGVWLTVFLLVGLGILVFATDPQIVQVREQQGLTPQDAGLSAFWLVAQIGLGLWLAAAMRKESVAPTPQPPEA